MSVTVEQLPGTAFLAFPDMANLLQSELAGRFNYGSVIPAPTVNGTSFSTGKSQQDKKVSANPSVVFTPGRAQWFGDLLYCPDFTPADSQINNLPVVPYWARTAMLKPFLLHFDSIGEAASELKNIQRNWAPYQFQLFRRASLIQEKLPYIRLKTREFPAEIPHSPMGLFTLIDDKTLIASAQTTSDIPAGTIEFEEDHVNPPSRAYLKIQESLTLAHHLLGVPYPKEGDYCFEAGACPGGWTWVLRKLGADVYAVDRAELAPSLMKDPHVKFVAHDAFTLKPEEIGNCEWVFSDVICYPERLLEWVTSWLDSHLVKNMICTIKMQGEVDWPLVEKFASIPNSRVVHLNYNKHELTWMHVSEINNAQ